MAESSPLDLYVLLFGGTIAMFLLASGVVGFILLYQRRIIRQDLAFKEAEAKHQQDLYHGTLDAIENERKRLARDLHDEVGASLSAMRLLVGQIQQKSTETAFIEDISTKCKTLIDSTIDNVRRISNDLLPQGLEEFGLPYAIEGLCEKTVEISKIDIHLKAENLENIDTKINLMVYRLIQELLNNAVKHSEATTINLSLKKEHNELHLNYADDGKGFVFAEAYEKRSLGLKNIETRTKMIDGVLKFDTKPNEGLKLEVRIPVQ
jgi:signal transduction histidine kinase